MFQWLTLPMVYDTLPIEQSIRVRRGNDNGTKGGVGPSVSVQWVLTLK